MSRRSAVLVGAALLLAAAFAIVVLTSVGRETRVGKISAASAGSSSPAPAPADQVAAALRGLATHPEALVADGAKQQLAGHESRAVPVGSTVMPDASSWAPDGLGGGTMLVTVTSPGHRSVTYATVMVFERHAWKVLATFPVGASR